MLNNRILKYFHFLALLLIGQSLCDNSPNICTDQGVCYKGAWLFGGSLSTKYGSFQGIRYAKPPVGNLRFKNPEPFEPEEGNANFDVSNETKILCIQNGAGMGQEDCLLLNVYVPEKILEDPENRVPVMVWIYGGGYAAGSGQYSDYGPQYFMEHGIILVTINYRLGPFGFFNLGNEEVPGNAAIKDQILALEWVKSNIQSFGGDPDAVTIFGQSAGSFSVSMHLLSPLSKGLFQRAILQSGVPINPAWRALTPDQALKYGNTLVERLGCHEVENSLDCLQNIDASEIDTASLELTVLSAWAPSPDSGHASNPVLPDDPEVLLSTGQFNSDVQVIVGTTKDEGILWFMSQLIGLSTWEDYKNTFDTAGIQQLFFMWGIDPTPEDIEKAHKVVDYYVGSFDNINEDHKEGLFQMATDALMTHGNYRTIDFMVKNGMVVYPYMLTYQGAFTIPMIYGYQGEGVGICHGDDLLYQWDPALKLEYGWDGHLNGEDTLVRDTIIRAWTNFAKYGDPTPPDSGLPSWTPQGAGEQYYWNILGPKPVMTSEVDLNNITARVAFWNSIWNN